MHLPRAGRFGAVLGAFLLACLACDSSPASPVAEDGQVDARLHDDDDDDSDFERRRGPREPFADLAIFFEENATDGDLGVQVFLDGEPWDRIRARDPGGRKVLDIAARKEFSDLGLTELRFESAEPSPQEVLGKIAPGVYTFTGRLIEGGMLFGRATLSSVRPLAPRILEPEDEGELDADDATIRWSYPGDVGTLAAFEVIVELDMDVDGVLPVISIILDPTATAVGIPAEFLKAGMDYKVEVLAIHENGNKTITEHAFSTE